MPNRKRVSPTLPQIGIGTSIVTLVTGLGAGVGAAINKNNVIESAAVSGLGSGLFMAGIGLAGKFGFFPESKPRPLQPIDHILSPALIDAIGTTVGYLGATFVLNMSVSTDTFLDAALGFPITAGSLFCFKVLMDYYHQNPSTQNIAPKPN